MNIHIRYGSGQYLFYDMINLGEVVRHQVRYAHQEEQDKYP